MAFAYTVQNTVYMGSGSVRLSGTWSGSAGDAAGTIAVAGPVFKADFQKFDSDNTFQGPVRVTSTYASGITTLTVNNQDNVTTGYFTIDKMSQ